jgi:F-box interacting protein
MVGTCNGLLCLHDDHTTYGGINFSAVTVINPVTGETAALPAVPTRWSMAQFAMEPSKYSFGFHPEAKLHKVVYIPRGERTSIDDVQVFTLDAICKAVWREVPVPVPGACYDLLCEPVSVRGSTYWLPAASSGTIGRVMTLDLRDERVTSLDARTAMGLLVEIGPEGGRRHNSP